VIITKKTVSRRLMLRGIGASLALPLLDAMVPAAVPLRKTAARAVRRLGIIYVPNGIVMNHWTPITEGTKFDLPSILEPLDPFRDSLQILSGMRGQDAEGPHARASTRFLTGVVSQRDTGSSLRAGISMDQIAGRTLQDHTQLPTLELGLDGRDFAGSCDEGFSCAYTNTISWANETTPLPMEINPRVVFERLFGDSGSTSPQIRQVRLARDASLLDSIMERAKDLSRRLGANDRVKLDQYLEAVRSIERRIQIAEKQDGRTLSVVDQPAGIPNTFGAHAKLMFDLLALAYETDLTRVATFMMGREITGRTYPEIGVPDAHHPISHHQKDPVKLEKLRRINRYHVELFTAFVKKLSSTPDGDSTLLDNSMIIYGAGMSDGNSHGSYNLPILLAGGGVGTGGRHIGYPKDTPLTNLHLTLLDSMGISVESLGKDSTGPLPLEPLSL
tara:strand:+ start:26270 stop:27604 length:1335 start_codon:yes stop_codon:yes gene_type:complete